MAIGFLFSSSDGRLHSSFSTPRNQLPQQLSWFSGHKPGSLSAHVSLGQVTIAQRSARARTFLLIHRLRVEVQSGSDILECRNSSLCTFTSVPLARSSVEYV